MKIYYTEPRPPQVHFDFTMKSKQHDKLPSFVEEAGQGIAVLRADNHNGSIVGWNAVVHHLREAMRHSPQLLRDVSDIAEMVQIELKGSTGLMLMPSNPALATTYTAWNSAVFATGRGTATETSAPGVYKVIYFDASDSVVVRFYYLETTEMFAWETPYNTVSDAVTARDLYVKSIERKA